MQYEGVYEIDGWELLEGEFEMISIENISTIVEEVHKQFGEHLLAIITFDEYEEPDDEIR